MKIVSIKSKAGTVNYSHHIEDLNSFLNTLIKNYLYNLCYGKLKHSQIKVKKIMGCINYFHPLLKPPNVCYDETTKLFRFDDLFLFASIEYNGANYELTFKTVFIESQRTLRIAEKNQVYISGFSSIAVYAKDLLKLLKQESIRNSSIGNKIMTFTSSKYDGSDILSGIEIVELPSITLSNIFIPESKQHQIKRFIYEARNFKKNRTALRYLLAGKPGTGKSNLITAIINEIKGEATVILCNGSELPIEEMFSFCKLFSPVILVIDDLDFLVSNRDTFSNNHTLGNFLNLLDGFLPNEVFLLATTNSKQLIDSAASRPGRFSVVLDIAEIDHKNYLQLIYRETEDEKIISFFNEMTLAELKSKNVSGALLVNLIKQLESCKRMKGEICEEDFSQYFRMLYDGFYASNSESTIKGFGFGA